MPTTDFLEYSYAIRNLLDNALSADDIVSFELEVDQRSAIRGLITGRLEFRDASTLHFREYIDLTQFEPRLTYAYHYQTAETALIFRYDNAAHRPMLPYADHKHTPDRIEFSEPPTLAHVLDEILTQIS
ncbi:MAG TPA: DUF6516 family protein [Anaerolineae bacterium]|nr:DUF6516 family protein [Anaerolineae bacterium]HQI87398.1 DUF6516 family protein [Anaerolineae bacterium]